MNKHLITIGWLYPELMSTYGDRGNILYFKRRCNARNIAVTVIPINQSLPAEKLQEVDFIFGGGSQDIEQEIVMRDLMGAKSDMIQSKIENNTPALFVCGSPQLMGRSYEPARGKKIQGVGVFDMESVSPGLGTPRCIGNTVGRVIDTTITDQLIIGFENHTGLSYLGKNIQPFAKVLRGYGNNGKDGYEGMVYKNAIGCYYHGPFLPKNPAVADFFIQRIIEVKYGEKVRLKPLPDLYEQKAREVLLKRFKVV